MTRSPFTVGTCGAAIGAMVCACSAIAGIPDRELASPHDGGAPLDGSAPLDAARGDDLGDATPDSPADAALDLATGVPTNLAAIETAPGDAAIVLVTSDGTWTVASENADGPWSGQSKISASGFAPPGAPVAVAWQTSTQLDAFVVGNDGTIFLSSLALGFTWGAARAITASGIAPAGAHLAAVQQGSSVDLFFVDSKGVVEELSLTGTTWAGPIALSDAGFAPAGAPIAHGAYSATQLDIAVVDTGGAVQAIHFGGALPGWSAPKALTSAAWTSPGASLEMQMQGTSQLDLFAVDAQGRVAVFLSDGDAGWANPSLITPSAGFAPPGASLAASPQGSQLDLFVVDAKGTLDVTFVIGNGGWSQPAALTAASFLQPGAPVAVAAQNASTLDAFFASNGAAWITWEANDGAWTAPATVL